MKTIIRLATLASAGAAALGLAGNALATQKLSVRQTATSLTIKATQAQSDPQPARIQIFVPSGYTLNTSQAPGTKIGTTSGSLFARDANVPVPFSGDVVVENPTINQAGCASGTHLAVWGLHLNVAGQEVTLYVHVDPTTGANAAFGAYQLVVCLGPSDVPPGTPGRSPNGAQLLETTFTVDNIFTPASGVTVWKALTTAYTPLTGVPNAAGTVETRSSVSPGVLTLNPRLVNGRTRTLRVSGRLSQAGADVGGASVNLLLNGKARFRARTTPQGLYSVVLRKTGRRSTTTFQARVTVAERDITGVGCRAPSLAAVPCVSATASGFTALSRKVRVRL
jgi:hypothetical protein